MKLNNAKSLRAIASLLIAAGTGLLAIAGWLWWEAERAQGEAQSLIELSSKVAFSSETQPGTGELVGVLSIDRLKLEVPVREGVDGGILRRGAGHVPGTAFPGQEGNVAIAAHRDTHFRPLRNLRVGDQITIRNTAGEFVYVAESTIIVEPHETEVLAPTPKPTLTLITCYPFFYVGPAPQRFIVRALLARHRPPGEIYSSSTPATLESALRQPD